MSVPAQNSLPDLADKPASGPLEPERTKLANGVVIHGRAPRLADAVHRRIPATAARQMDLICTPRVMIIERTRAAPSGGFSDHRRCRAGTGLPL
jgi:hypothetical protein